MREYSLRTVLIVILLIGNALSRQIHAQCGITSVNGDLILSSNTSLSGTYNLSGTFKVLDGVTVTVTPFSSNGCGELTINASNIIIDGTIDANGAGFSGGIGGTGGSTGNNTEALTGCVYPDSCIVINVTGGVAGSSGSGAGGGVSGSHGGFGSGPKQVCSSFGDSLGFVPGAGGAGGGGGGTYGGTTSLGGEGGAGAEFNLGDFTGIGIAGCAYPTAGAGGIGGGSGGVYGTSNSTDIALGSGGAGAGGGGKSRTNGLSGGLGGTGGGLIKLLAADTLVVSGNILAKGTVGGSGGNGGNGGITSDCCGDACNDCGERTYASGAGGGGGGGGGSGGGILLLANGPCTIDGNLSVEGGNGGIGGSGGSGTSGCSYSDFLCGSNSGSANAGASGDLGGAGSGGRIKIFTNPCETNSVNASIFIDGGNGNGGQAASGTSFIGNNPNSLNATSSIQPISCNGLNDGAITVSVSGGTQPYSLVWTPNVSADSAASGLSAGIYQIVISDATGCGLTRTVNLIEPDILIVTGNDVVIIPPDTSGQLNGIATGGSGGNYTFEWSPSTGLNNPNISNPVVTPTQTNSLYILTVTDSNGCQSLDDVLVTLGPIGIGPNAHFIVEPSCGVAPLSVSFQDQSTNNPTSWEWFFNGGSPQTSTDQHPQDIVFSQPGNYSVLLTAINGLGYSNAEYSYICVVENITDCESCSYVGLPEKETTHVQLHPNPNFGQFELVVSELRGKTSYRIHDNLGQLVKTGSIIFKRTTIDMQQFAEGVYSLTLVAGNKVVGIERVVLMKN